VTGRTMTWGGWCIEGGYAYAPGNYFNGPNGDFGANANDEWEGRFNINFGYYF